MTDEELEEGFRSLAEYLSKKGNTNHRRYELKSVDGRPMLIRDDFCRAFEAAVSETFGIDIEPDDRDGTFLA
jgi:hypothetical protein